MPVNAPMSFVSQQVVMAFSLPGLQFGLFA